MNKILQFKGELGELEFYFRKIPLHQQKFLVVSVVSNSPWLLNNLKMNQNEVTKHFSVGNTLSNDARLASSDFSYLLRNDMN